jgi:hypothetical protein
MPYTSFSTPAPKKQQPLSLLEVSSIFESVTATVLGIDWFVNYVFIFIV